MKVTQQVERTLDVGILLKHPENYNIIGVIDFGARGKYLYKLCRLDKEEFVWANMSKPACLNNNNDSNRAAVFYSTALAVNEFLCGGEQYSLHAFNTTSSYLQFLSDNLK